jgi:hypothetical protein
MTPWKIEAETLCQVYGLAFQEEAMVLQANKEILALRIGYLDGHFLVNIGLDVAEKITWVGFQPMTTNEFSTFLQDALPKN